MSEIVAHQETERVPSGEAFPFDRMVPITMSHYPITYSGVINHPDEATLAHYAARLAQGRPGDNTGTMMYLHIPFCDQLCTFCRYARDKTPEREVFANYAAALKEEMRRHLESRYVQETNFDLIYFGGGTPSVMPLDIMEDLLRWINAHFTRGRREISFEGEARTIKDPEYLAMLKEQGATRVSMGVQTFDPKLRKLLGRHESVDDVYEAIENVKKVGLEINFDLLYWLPYQTIEHLEADIAVAARLGPTDVDWYNMVYDPLLKNDPLSRLVTKKKDALQDTLGLLEMRKTMRDGFRRVGYVQHFVDNYASSEKKDLYHVIRTGNYDGSGRTLGVGVSSLGTLGTMVYSNPDDLDSYYRALKEKKYVYKWVFDLTEERQIERTLFHFARNMRLPKRAFAGATPATVAPYLDRIEHLVNRELIDDAGDDYGLTEQGKLWYGNVASYLLGNVEHEKVLKRLYLRILR